MTILNTKHIWKHTFYAYFRLSKGWRTPAGILICRDGIELETKFTVVKKANGSNLQRT